MASPAGDRRGDHRVRHGHRQGDVRYVYHYNLPKSLESYSQEIGRAGRDGAPSTVEMLACPDDVPTLENFAYGDTPTEVALRGLVDELLGAGPGFDVSLYDLVDRHDLRQLVLRTALTYLELLGVLRQGTPFYAGVRDAPAGRAVGDSAQFKGERRSFSPASSHAAKQGRIWYALDPDDGRRGAGPGPATRRARARSTCEEQGWPSCASPTCASATAPAADGGRQRAGRRAARAVSRRARRRRCPPAAGARPGHSRRLPDQRPGRLLRRERGAACGHCTYCLTGARPTCPPPPAAAAPGGRSIGAILRRVRRAPGGAGRPAPAARGFSAA